MVEFIKRGLSPQSPARSPLGCSSCSPRIFFNLEGRCDSLFSSSTTFPNTKHQEKLSVYICISDQLAKTKDFQRTDSNSSLSHFLVVFFLSLFCCLVAKLCPTVCHPMDRSSPGFSVHGILQARILEWVAIPFSRGSSRPNVSCIGRWILYC